MISIFELIRKNDVQAINGLIGLATGEMSVFNYNNGCLSKEALLDIQLQLKITGSKSFDLNRRSSNGKAALHCAVIWNRQEIVQNLVDCPLVNVNLQDQESGWTALHKALYIGNVGIARILLQREDIDLSIKDWDGLSAFEIYSITMDDMFSISNNENRRTNKPLLENTVNQTCSQSAAAGSTNVYTWGQNANYVLGHPDSENRTRPECVHFDLNFKTMEKAGHIVEFLTMAKYHMAILTSKPSNNLFVCGYGRGGRLGLGKDIDTQLIPIAIHWPERIISVALGQDHTIALTESGTVITFGSNEFGKLGHELDSNRTRDETTQYKPKRIQAQQLKKEQIIGIAASKVHSVMHTKFDLYTFGLNQGQLGYFQTASDTEYQAVPRKVSMSVEIQQVVATESVTAVLSKSHEVFLFYNHAQERLFFPFNSFPSDIKAEIHSGSFIKKLISSDKEYLGAITNLGDMFIWACKLPVKNCKMEVKTPKKIWSTSKSHLYAVDASIGQCGEVIICTAAGNVFLGYPGGSGYKFKEVPHIQRCIQVCSNSSGSFAAIRSEYVLQSTPIIPSTIKHDISLLLPHFSVEEMAHKQMKCLNNQQVEETLKSNEKDYFVEAENRQDKQKIFTNLTDEITYNIWQQNQRNSQENDLLDVVFVSQDKNIYCHSAILISRSKAFKHLIEAAKPGLMLFGNPMIIQNDKRVEVHINEYEPLSILLMINYIYTDKYEYPKQHSFYSSKFWNSANEDKIQKDLEALAKSFDLPYLLSSVQSPLNQQPVLSLVSDLDCLFGYGQPNVLIKTKTKDFLSHEIILRQRCIFFNNLFSSKSVWMFERKKKQKAVEVDLQFMTSDVAEVIIRFLYSDFESLSTMAQFEKGTEEETIQFLMEILQEADGLLLERLKSIVENALVGFIKVRTVLKILECASASWAQNLQDACLVFIQANLSIFICSGALDCLPDFLIAELEKHIQQSQADKMPFVYNTSFKCNWDIDSSQPIEDEFLVTVYSLTRGNETGVDTFLERFVTVYPEILPVTQKVRKTLPKQQQRNTYSFIENTHKDPIFNWASGTEDSLTQKLSLRKILREEQPNVAPASKTTKVFNHKKASQKERRKASVQAQEASSSLDRDVWGIETTTSPSKATPKCQEPHLLSGKGKKIYISEESLNSPENRQKDIQTESTYNPIENIGPLFQITPIRRFMSKSNQNGSQSALQSFKTIQNEQLEDYQIKSIKPKKNLGLIQREEQAILELKQSYIQTSSVNSGEWCEMLRCAKKQ